jgi:hypothetical protein
VGGLVARPPLLVTKEQGVAIDRRQMGNFLVEDSAKLGM